MSLFLKCLLGAVAVLLIALLSRTKNFFVAGLVPLFPTFALIAHYIVGTHRGRSASNGSVRLVVAASLRRVPDAGVLAQRSARPDRDLALRHARVGAVRSGAPARLAQGLSFPLTCHSGARAQSDLEDIE